MKKALLLSVVASTMIMAGGDIVATEPAVEAVAVEASTWDFTGQGVLYTQTVDVSGNNDLFANETTYAGWGIQLGATASDLFAGIGAGVEVSGIVASTGDAGFYNGGGNTGTTSGGLTQAYLTYGMGATSIKVGRQQLPKSLSPFAYSEGWQIFKNTFDAALIVNSSVPNTTLVYAAVGNANGSVGAYLNEDAFSQINENGDIVHMVAVQNKSIDGLTLTGTYYFAPDFKTDGNDLSAVWGDAKYNAGSFNVAVQGGQIDPGDMEVTTAFGGKIGAKFGMFTAMAAYSSVDQDGVMGITNLATGVKSPLYTQMLLDNVSQYHAAPGSEFVKVGATAKVLGGTVKAFYGAGTNDIDQTKGNYTEFDLMYVTKISENVKFFAAYAYTDDDMYTTDTATGTRPSANNFIRFWARYNFN
ncbi:MAG: hypothetical protein Q9M36_09690 [Sulfurovum sp.]|nr:hypothetical protein [Sulfurovum sp.]